MRSRNKNIVEHRGYTGVQTVCNDFFGYRMISLYILDNNDKTVYHATLADTLTVDEIREHIDHYIERRNAEHDKRRA